MADTKQKQQKIEKLMRDVVTFRQECPDIYADKLSSFFRGRAIAMKNGIFDGRKIPEPIFVDTNSLAKAFEKNNELLDTAMNRVEKTAYLRSLIKKNDEEMKHWESSLDKVDQITRLSQQNAENGA